MRRVTIKTALTLALSIITTGIIILSVTSFYGMSTVYANLEDIGGPLSKRQAMAAALKTEFMGLRLTVAKVSLAKPDPNAMRQAIEISNAQADKLAGLVSQYQSMARTGKGKELVDKIASSIAAYEEVSKTLANLWLDGKNAEAQAISDQKIAPTSAAAAASVDALLKYIETRINDTVASSATTKDNMTLLMMIMSAFSIMFALAGMWYVIFGVANPIGKLADAMRRLADGDLKSQIPFAGRQDELGNMAAAVEVFRHAGVENQRLEAEAAETRRQQEEATESGSRRAAEEAHKLRFATQTLGEGLQRLAAGDLSVTISQPFAQEYDSLRIDFNSSIQQLGQTIRQISDIVQAMDNGTREIADGTNDLSRRTEQQAASLEETAAALDQITSNVGNAAKRTDEARTVAQSANENASVSASVVTNAENAMRRIEDSSQQISNIIGVIDEIAFQTNLLALNAGVEAARAGEAGKGFAVVAQEVRELAQRSANAAKEIKGLIHNSSQEVDSGVKLVRDTGVALKAIGEQVAQINLLMGEIATSSREQSTGLSEVNSAMNEMDQTTQQNAAMVEQSTAAASNLAQEAERLRDLVNHFKLRSDREWTNGADASRHAA